MDRITHFEIPSDKPEVSTKFYSDVFGWKCTKWGEHEYWLVATGEDKQPGINGAIMKKRDPKQPVVNSINVKDIDATIKAIETNGGKIVVPKGSIPGVGYLAYFTDPDGNIHGVIQEDKNAK
jgi:predicted enzyme related to lactoylglutathione lyase